jgi:hypothetical protein
MPLPNSAVSSLSPLTPVAQPEGRVPRRHQAPPYHAASGRASHPTNDGPAPAFSWSFSRSQLIERCERLYYEHYYGAHGGCAANATPRARLAYRLKQLTTPNAELGRAIHRRAQEIAQAVRDRMPPPTAAELYGRTRTELEAVVMRRATDAAWLTDPRRAPLLHEVYYGGVSMGCRRQLLTDLCARAVALHAALLDAPVWRAAALPGARFLYIDEPILTVRDGVSTMSTPDLVLQLPDDRVIVVDWKTGGSGDMTQPILYAHAVQSALGTDGAASAFEAWLIHLDRGTMEAVTVTTSDIATALGAQQKSLERMRDLLVDPTRNVPKPRATFAPVTDPNRDCRRCKMLALCSLEFNRRTMAAL